METGNPRVMILGCGPAGSSAAIALARAGVDCLQIDRGDGSQARFGECLPPSSKPLLARLGLRSALEAGGHLPCLGNCSIWGSNEVHEYDFLYSRHGHGWSLNRVEFDQQLANAARLAGVRQLNRTKVVSHRRTASRWEIELHQGEDTAIVRPEVVIDATGRRSWFALRQGAKIQRDDSMIALCADLPANPELRDNFTCIEAVEKGWWYSAFTPGDRLAAAYFTDGELLDPHAARSENGWLELLRQAPRTMARLGGGGAVPARSPVLADASTRWLDRAAGEGWIAVGDAAAAFDPLSSHGITTAIAAGQFAAREILQPDHGGRFHSYAEGILALVDKFRRERQTYYAAEKRWSQSPFWIRRSGVSSASSALGSASPAFPLHPASSTSGSTTQSGHSSRSHPAASLTT